MEIYKLTPACTDYIWGGTLLRDSYGIECDLERIAEAWVLSCHPNGKCTIASGECVGQSLAQLLEQHPEYIGQRAKGSARFPVLVKLIDAKDDLSVQVHPDDEYAMLTEGEPGKTEMWYVVEAAPDANLIYGFEREITQEQFRCAIENGTLLECLHRVEVKAGDVFFIESGTLHAIGKGMLIAEIQQSSDTTYRVFDYNRIGTDGKPRQLHVDKALDVTITSPPTVPPGAAGEKHTVCAHEETLLASCEYFTASLAECSAQSQITVDAQSFVHLLMLDGDIILEDDMLLRKGESAFVPAGYGVCRINGEGRFILTSI